MAQRRLATVIGGEDWGFWDRWERGTWEPETKAVLERLLTPESTYFDVGAWIGPTVLWAAPLCKRVVALEPDPVAYDMLLQNTASLPNVEAYAAALVGIDCKTVELFPRGRWGDSMSSTWGEGESLTVLAVQIADVWDDKCALVKMDIEGGEADVLPTLAPFLVERRVPLLVSIHEPWMSAEGREGIAAALAQFDSTERLTDDAGYYEVLALC